MVRVRPGQARGEASGTRVNYSGYTSLQEDIRKGIVDTTDSPGNPYSVAMRRVGELYREFLKRRFDRLKAGGGSWEPIKKSTVKWRKSRHGITHRQILYVTRSLYKTTNSRYGSAAGQYEKRTKYGITVGVSSETHPDAGISFRRLVQIHAQGLGRNLPERVIYRPADEPTKQKMNASLRRAHQMAVNKANRKVKTETSS